MNDPRLLMQLALVLALVLVLALALAAPATSICPQAQDIKPCTCDDEGLQCLKLNDSGLIRVFQAEAEKKAIRRVWIFQTNVTSLPKNAFGQYIIRDLYLDLNQIHTVESGAFGEAVNTLQSLSLTRNFLAHFPLQDLKTMKKLKQLGLGYNRLTLISSGSFPASDTLESLDLSHNQIERIEPEAFAQLTAVTLIDLSRNNMTLIEPKSLLIKSMYQELVISLRGNSIKRISPDAFGGYHPRGLDLSRNQLVYLDKRVFMPLLNNGTMINVEDNPFSCLGCSRYKWLLHLDKEATNNLENFACADETKLEDLTLESIGCTELDKDEDQSDNEEE